MNYFYGYSALSVAAWVVAFFVSEILWDAGKGYFRMFTPKEVRRQTPAINLLRFIFGPLLLVVALLSWPLSIYACLSGCKYDRRRAKMTRIISKRMANDRELNKV